MSAANARRSTPGGAGFLARRLGRLALGLLAVAAAATAGSARAADDIVYFFNDALGSAVGAYNEAGERCWAEEYTPYGDKRINDDTFAVPGSGCGLLSEERGFAGHTEDRQTDLVYMQQRYYDPSIGRFLSVDPMAADPDNPDTYNRYAYGYDNPLAYKDPDGEFAFLVPLAVFVGKEVVAEIASQATGGATDLLSARRVATRAAAFAAKKGGQMAANIRRTVSNNCSFEGSTQVLTDAGAMRIDAIEPGVHRVWSRDEATGETGFQPVLEAFVADYDVRVTIEIVSESTGARQTLVSNTIHPYLVASQLGPVVQAAYSPRRLLPAGTWREAIELRRGDRLFDDSERWWRVASVAVKGDPLTAYNIDVANFDSFFAGSANAGGLIWTHNCGRDETALSREGLTFDQAREEAFEKAGMTDPAAISISKVDEVTGTAVEFKGPGGAKVGYDGPHQSPGPHHDVQHISYQSSGKRREGGASRGNIPYSGTRHPSRPDRKEQ